MSSTLRAPIALFDYLTREESNQVRHEYVGGEVHAMVGGTLRHNRIAGNIYRLLTDRLHGAPCQVFMEGVKLHVQAADAVYYPDVLVYCGSSVADDTKVLQDAALVVEVLSDSTVEIDRREKLVAYRKLPALRGYWIVSQREQRVEARARDATGQWLAQTYGPGDAIPATWLGGASITVAWAFIAGTDIA
ncbi:MAG: Uma2 family endonuclease [Aquincola sp.]|nr:Uma2 family endonuclease [Aquincola sp.]